MAQLKSTSVVGTFSATGNSIFDSLITAKDSISILKNLEVAGMASITGDLTVNGRLIGGSHTHKASDVVIYSITTPTYVEGALWLKPL